MKITCSLVALAVVMGSIAFSACAAPVESVNSSHASAARQKVDAFLGEKIVAQQLTALGISQAQVNARLAQLNDAQLQQLAAQVDLIRSGGTIQSGGLNRIGPLGYLAAQLRAFFREIYQTFIVWADLN